jgi:hypothetical protein
VSKLGLDASWQSETTKFSPVNDTKEVDDKEQNREDWLELQKQYPDATKTQLRKLSPRLYARLYRGDRIWLNDNSPKIQKPSVSVFFDEEVKEEIDFLGRIMDEISDRAVARGLTPEILADILND